MNQMKLERERRQHSGEEALSRERAEVISRLWQAIAFLDEARTDATKQIRQSAARDAAVEAMLDGTQNLVRAAAYLMPDTVSTRISKVEHIPEPEPAAAKERTALEPIRKEGQ